VQKYQRLYTMQTNIRVNSLKRWQNHSR